MMMKAAKLGWAGSGAGQEQTMSRPGAGWEHARSRPGVMQEQGRSKSWVGALAVHIPKSHAGTDPPQLSKQRCSEVLTFFSYEEALFSRFNVMQCCSSVFFHCFK